MFVCSEQEFCVFTVLLQARVHSRDPVRRVVASTCVAVLYSCAHYSPVFKHSPDSAASGEQRAGLTTPHHS